VHSSSWSRPSPSAHVRAKRTLAEARVPFEVPRRDELAARLSSVLEVIYLIFNEGYSATAGNDWMRPALCEDALRLGSILAELAQRERRSTAWSRSWRSRRRAQGRA
jgi:predicted RNA polymerase sigma factor